MSRKCSDCEYKHITKNWSVRCSHPDTKRDRGEMRKIPLKGRIEWCPFKDE